MKGAVFKIIIILIFPIIGYSQSAADLPQWDNQFFIGNKVAWGGSNWRYSAEIQSRYYQNLQVLDRWFVEGVASYMPSENWEIVPDLRVSVRTGIVEYRLGIGFVRKDLINKKDQPIRQFVQQVKYQSNITKNFSFHELRYILFYNYELRKNIIASGIAGLSYNWKRNYQGIEIVRGGLGLAYVINNQHTLNLSYLAGGLNVSNGWKYSGGLVVQLIINIRKDYKYVPAKYLNI